MADEVLLSREGYEKLKAELEFLKVDERMRIADQIREAKSHGDLRENAMYHEAKLNQKRLEGRIAELEKALQVSRVVEDHEKQGAHLGSTVKLRDLMFGDEFEIHLVGAFEADPTQDMISIGSPLGMAVKGKDTGDEVEVQAPAGVQRYKIIEVR